MTRDRMVVPAACPIEGSSGQPFDAYNLSKRTLRAPSRRPGPRGLSPLNLWVNPGSAPVRPSQGPSVKTLLSG
jgi:hypothetical protein